MSNFLEIKPRSESRVGPDYQAVIPDVVKKTRRALYMYFRGDLDLIQWRPSDALTDEQTEQFIALAKDHYDYSEEQALGFLFWHEYDLAKAMKDISKFYPASERWTAEDEVYFKESLRFDRKNLLGISRKMRKSMNLILLHYYKWKGPQKKKTNMLARIKQEVVDENSDEFKETLANIKKEALVPVLDTNDEFNKTLARIKQEEPEEDADVMNYSLNILRIKQETPD